MLVRSRNTSFQRPTIGLLGLPPKEYRITGITGQVIDCHRAAMRRTKMLIRRTPFTPRSRPLRRLTPLRQVSDRMLTMDPAVVHARERVEERDGNTCRMNPS